MAIDPLTPERRRQQTRDYLLRAAEEVFAARGFHGASLDEVAAVAGFTKGAVYSNFKNKDDLFLALLESRSALELDALRATVADSESTGGDDLSRFVALIRNQLASAGHIWGPLYQEFSVYAMRNDEARAKLAQSEQADIDAIAELISAERKRHGFENTEPVEHIARIVVALTRGLFGMQLINPGVIDDALLETTLAFIARALIPATDRAAASGPEHELLDE
jgi:AcrR family transcriptional regulator